MAKQTKRTYWNGMFRTKADLTETPESTSGKRMGTILLFILLAVAILASLAFYARSRRKTAEAKKRDESISSLEKRRKVHPTVTVAELMAQQKFRQDSFDSMWRPMTVTDASAPFFAT